MQVLTRSSRRLLVLLAVILGACKSGTEPPTPTSVVVRTAAGANAATLASIGQTVALTAKVVDQFGDTMTGQTVTWSSNASAIATVSATGTVTAVSNGSTQVTATSGSATGSLGVTVTQGAAAVQKQSGDAQSGTVGAALGQPIVVKVVDGLGVAIAGAAVNWAVVTGGGTLTPSGVTDAQGVASATWTPGTTAGNASATATAGGITATFTATLQAGAAAQVTVVTGNNQTAAVGTPVGIAPKVRVADQFGNIKVGHTVTWTVTAGGGTVQASAGSAATSTTDALGDATVVSWTLGSVAGANALQASAAAGVTATVNATGASAGAPTSIAIFAGDGQTALVSFPTNTRPAVRVTDANNLPVSGQQVVFTPSGSGSVTGGTVTTNANGVAQVGSWTPGTSAGAATLTAAATGTALQSVFNGAAANAAYDIDVRNIGPAFSPSVAAAFAAAEALWEQIIYGDQSNVLINNTNACGLGATISETVDDIIILARFDSIDGPANILGQAGACSIRGSNGLTIYGQMVFDTADLGLIGSNLDAVIVHEMGHVLGFSAGIFNSQSGVTNQIQCAQMVSAPGLDSHFNCTQVGAQNYARAAFDSIGGTSYTGGNKVPLENCVAGVPANCGAGTLYSHWRELTFFNELMSGYYNGSAPSNPLSVLTIAAMRDIGYQVNYGAAQPYTRTFTAPAAARGPVLDLTNDEYRGPVEVVDDASGRVLRVIRR